MERCPHCNARQRGETQCARCQMELGLLLAVERAAARALSVGLEALARDPAQATRAFARAVALQRTPLHLHLRAFAQRLAAERV